MLLVLALLPKTGDSLPASAANKCCQLAINLAGGTYSLKLVLSGKLPQVCSNCSAVHHGPGNAQQSPNHFPATVDESDEISRWRQRTMEGNAGGDDTGEEDREEKWQRKRRRYSGGAFVPEACVELANGMDDILDSSTAGERLSAQGELADGQSRGGARAKLERYACSLGRQARLLLACDAAASHPQLHRALAPLAPPAAVRASRHLLDWPLT